MPFTADHRLVPELAALGERLTTLHLLKSPELDPPTCRFDGQGDSRIARGRRPACAMSRGGRACLHQRHPVPRPLA